MPEPEVKSAEPDETYTERIRNFERRLLDARNSQEADRVLAMMTDPLRICSDMLDAARKLGWMPSIAERALTAVQTATVSLLQAIRPQPAAPPQSNIPRPTNKAPARRKTTAASSRSSKRPVTPAVPSGRPRPT